MGNKNSIQDEKNIHNEEKEIFIKKCKNKLLFDASKNNFWIMSKEQYFEEGEQEKYKKWIREEFDVDKIHKLEKMPEIPEDEWWDFLYVKLNEK